MSPVISLKNGLKVVALPTLPRNQWGKEEPMSEEETVAFYDAFFAQISEQGGEIVGTFAQKVRMPDQGGVSGAILEERLFFIVKK